MAGKIRRGIVSKNIILHVACFGDALRRTQEQLDQKNYYLYNPEYMHKKKK